MELDKRLHSAIEISKSEEPHLAIESQPANDPSIPNSDPSIPNSDPSIPNSDPSIPNSDPSIGNCDPSIPNSKQQQQEKQEPEDNKIGWRSYIGFMATLVHVLAYTLCAVIIKMLPFHPFCIGVYRFQGVLLPSIVALLYNYYTTKNKLKQVGQERQEQVKTGNHNSDKSKTQDMGNAQSFFVTVWPISNSNWKTVSFILLRGFLATTAVLLLFYALKFIGIADTMVITGASPVFVIIVAYFWLKEPCGIFEIILALLSVVGIFIVLRPPMLTGAKQFDSNTVIGCSLAAGSVLFYVIPLVILRIVKHVPAPIITFSFGLWGSLQCLVLGISFRVLEIPQTMEHTFLTIALALLTYVAQVSFTIALQNENAGPAAMIRSTGNVIFSFVWPYLFFAVIPDSYSLLGASIVMICILGILLRKWLSELHKDHILRKYLCFVLK